jgi:ParB-like chromosome segregation protein Spo0J
MKTTTIKINVLRPHPKNPRHHNDFQINELAKSVDKFGQIRPIVIDENNVILAGHGLVKALKSLGWEDCTVIRKHNLSEDEKIKLLLADNKLGDLGRDDNKLLYDLIKGIDTPEIPGFDTETLSKLFGDVNNAIDNFEVPKTESTGKSVFEDQGSNTETKSANKAVICPSCGEVITL